MGVQHYQSKSGANGGVLTARRFDVPGEPESLSATQITQLRREVLGVSQRLFAGLLSVAPQTVHAWEQGLRTPSGMALRLLNLARKHPKSLRLLIAERANGKKRNGGELA
jgi:putative transcriptional regulator